MISSGELFLLNGDTLGEFQPLPAFLNQNIRVIAASLGRAYVATEPAVCPPDLARRPCTVWCFEGSSSEPTPCPEFDEIEDNIKQIAIGEKHLLVLTHSGDVYTKGGAIYGSAGHGGAKDVPEFAKVPALKGHNVKFVAAGPYFSIAITEQGDVFSWGQAFSGETGLFSQVDTVPRFAAAVAPFRVTEISCGHAHVLGRTETQHCIAWGENTSGQLGLGQKSKPTHKPQLIEAIPSQVAGVSAGWAHSVAVGTDGRVYSWGLNSHGQLGLGDTTTRFAPHLLHALTGTYEVESAHASKVSTLFKATGGSRPLLCGKIPSGAVAADNPRAAVGVPRRPGASDPAGCLLCPVPLQLAGGMGMTNNHSELTQVVAFDRGSIGFARSTVYKVGPSLAPIQGGTQVQVWVTGLPFERPSRFTSQSGLKPLQDIIPVKVRLRSSSPLLDVVVPGRIVDVDTVEFITPDVTLSPLGSVAEQSGCAAVQLQVSIDDGFTWTMEKSMDPGRSMRANGDQPQLSDKRKKSERRIVAGIEELKGESEAAQNERVAKSALSTLLWYCRWPRGGPSHVEPSCAPVTGGTELLLHIQLPPRIPTDNLTVKFVCKPLYSINDPEQEAKAPMRRDASDIINPCHDAIAKLPLVGPLDVLVNGWLDPGGRGVRCISPPLDAENVKYYEYHMELSLDGRRFLDRGLPFNIYDLRVTGLEPCLGPLTECTEVRIKTSGLVKTEIQKVRIDFPKDLMMPSRQLPAHYDHTTGEVAFAMPELSAEVRRGLDKAASETRGARSAEPSPAGGDPPGDPAEEEEEEAPAVDVNGGLAGLEVFVELSLNGQNFTEDRVHFTYHGTFEPASIRVIAPPEGGIPADHQADTKGDKGKKKGGEESSDMLLVYPGSKLACEVRNLVHSESAAIRAELTTKVGDEEPQPFRTVEFPATIALVTPAPEHAQDDAGKKGKKDAEPAADEEAAEPIEMLVAFAPAIRTEDLPDPSAILIMNNLAASLNGQQFLPIAEAVTWRLQPQAPERKATAEES